MKLKIISILSVLYIVVSCGRQTSGDSYADITIPADEHKIDSILKILTLEEKVNMLCGNGLFTSAGIERLGIEDLNYTDGPFGIREELGKKSWAPLGLTTDSATFFPTGSALAATWNPELAWLNGKAMGEEARTRGKDILLGPAINITRTPLNGRTYEYMSEDPLINAELAVSYVKGVQSAGVVACIKHFAVNNQETMRGEVDVQVDERALREIYLPAFKAAVTEAGAYAVMSAYNKVRGDYCAENEYLLNHILREEWQFKGMVVSDWGGTHSTVKSAMNGLDVEMGSELYFNKPLLDSVKAGKVPESAIDEKVRRILRAYFFSSRKPVIENDTVVSTPEHNQVAYDIASQSIVLLKNTKSLLPLNRENLTSLAVIGENAVARHALGGFGAGVKARHEVTPLEGLKNRLGNKVKIEYASGYESSYVTGMRFVPDHSIDQKLIDEAVQAALRSQYAIIVAGTNREVETESFDRLDLKLPFGQDELIRAVCAVNPNTVVVIVAGAPVDLQKADSSASAIVWSWFNGSQAGYALADVLLGKVNPSGKLPFTIPADLNDSPAHALETFPGDGSATYKEGILVGYRWFDTKNISPAYPFGYGLSYTEFEYTSLSVDKKSYGSKDIIKVMLKIKNTGKFDGMETVQLYITDNAPEVMKPARELKAFKKILVKSGGETDLEMEIPVSDLSWYDENNRSWIVSSGSYLLAAGSSSRDIRKVAEIIIR